MFSHSKCSTVEHFERRTDKRVSIVSRRHISEAEFCTIGSQQSIPVGLKIFINLKTPTSTTRFGYDEAQHRSMYKPPSSAPVRNMVLAERCALLSAEILKSQGKYSDAATLLIKMTSEVRGPAWLQFCL